MFSEAEAVAEAVIVPPAVRKPGTETKSGLTHSLFIFFFFRAYVLKISGESPYMKRGKSSIEAGKVHKISGGSSHNKRGMFSNKAWKVHKISGERETESVSVCVCV